jgi:hypothetical protein
LVIFKVYDPAVVDVNEYNFSFPGVLKAHVPSFNKPPATAKLPLVTGVAQESTGAVEQSTEVVNDGIATQLLLSTPEQTDLTQT